MAARRFYAYYVRGKQLALVEYDNVSGSGQTLGQPSLDDIGPSGGLQWKSPVASITDGIEIEYAYSPRYKTYSHSQIGANKFYVNGWTVVDGYLTFLRAPYIELDQEQTIGSGQTTLADVSQSFTAGKSGFLAAVSIMIVTGDGIDGDLTIYSGAGTGGTQLYTQSIVYNAGTYVMQPFHLTNGPLLTADSVYTLRFQGDSNFVIRYHGSDVYSGGIYTGTPGADMIFRTYIGEGPLTDWTSAPESTVTSGSSGDTGGQTLDYIVVSGSSRWNGLHKVQTAGTEGQLKTYTKVGESLPYWTGKNIGFGIGNEPDGTFRSGAAGQIYDPASGANLWLADHFSAGDYVWVSGVSTTIDSARHDGLFRISSVTQSGTSEDSVLNVDAQYSVLTEGIAGSLGKSMSTEKVITPNFGNEYLDTTAGQNTGVDLYKAHRDFCYISTDVDVLNDETDTIDLPEYLAKGLVYYVKAKMAEDMGDMEQKEYNMREFRRILEKHESSKIWGARMITAGPSSIR